MKITLISLIVLGSLMAQAQTDAIEIAYAEDAQNTSSEVAALMTPAVPAEAARPAYEVTCRDQAKEVAANAYRGCMSDNRNAQIEQLKKDYQAEIKGLKEKYESEIKNLKTANAADKAANAKAKQAAKKEAAALNKEASATPAAAPAAKAKKAAPAKTAVKAPNQKAKKVAATAPAKAVQAQANKIAGNEPAEEVKSAAADQAPVQEMTIELKKNKAGSLSDDSTMDLPEPIPVQN